ncbi:MAG TPA: histidine kinase [Actinomycetota bacterium]|nr:histidine kinase [Actinomycetota bacterium]
MSGGDTVDSERRDRRLRALAWTIFGLALTGALVGIWMEFVTGKGDAVFTVLVFAFPLTGVLILHRRPRTNLGWLMLSMGIGFALPFDSIGHLLLSDDPASSVGAVMLALGGPVWVPFIGISGFLLLLFPDGHLPSPRWRWFAWTCGIGLVLLALMIMLTPGTFAELGYPTVENPLGIEALGTLDTGVFALVAFAPLTVAGGAVAVIRRLRRARDPVQRQQLRWLAWAAGVIATVYLLAFVPNAFGLEPDSALQSWLESIGAMSFLLIPITIGIAVLRYRLYDIDVVIRKTVVFAVLATFIAAVYVALVIGVGALVGSRGSPVLSAAAAAVVALVFQPLRRRAHRFADRVVYGKRATPYELLTSFGDQLAGTYSADDVLPRIARVLGEGVGAARACVWLRVGEALRVVARWPSDASDDRVDDLMVDVLHTGESLGALSVAMPANDPMDPPKEQLVRDLAGHAGLVLSNVRLTEELRARLDDLRAAQKRLVTAQDEERRRLERNIHDGAQQQLVALSVKLRLAQALAPTDGERTAGMLEQLQEETTHALEDLRDLARGIYPPLLADKGLPAALDAQARRSPIPVRVLPDGVGRYAQEVEAAVYFSVLEGLQNVAKYSDATAAEIRLREEGGWLTFRVEDDGRGFDLAETGYGTGLQGIADRLAALDGALEVRSSVGVGTALMGRVPVRAPAGAPDPERQPGERS